MALIAGLDAAKTGRASMVGALLIAAAISIGIDPAMRNPIGELGIDSACGKTRKPLMCTRAPRAGSSVPGTLRDQDRKTRRCPEITPGWSASGKLSSGGPLGVGNDSSPNA